MREKFFIAAALVGVLVMNVGCRGNSEKVVQAAPKPIVVTTIAQQESIAQTVEFTSSIAPYSQNYINPSMQVRIDKILVDVGSTVRKGQLLVVMDQTQLSQLNLQVANLQADYDRILAVYEAGGISKQQIDQAKTTLDVQIKSMNNIRSNLELRSPIDGVVTAKYYDQGDIFAMGSPGILQVMQINKLKVSVALSEQYFTQIKLGMEADVVVETLGDESFPGKVSLIHPAIDPATRTFVAEITIANGSGRLRPGMYSRTTLNFGSKDGIVVDDLAVQKQYGTNEKYLFIVEDGKAIRRTVEAGRQQNGMVNIVSGVSAGDQVVVSGISKISDGVAVEVKNK